MSNRRVFCCLMSGMLVLAGTAAAQDLTSLEQLGKHLFFDHNLSTPPGQSCAACHGSAVGFTGPVASINAHGAVYPGAVHTRFGNRKPPTSAYAGGSPIFHFDAGMGSFVGGMFWDGRATGLTLGDPLAEQAQGPFLNPLEQNNPNARSVCLKVKHSDYARLFEEVWGPGSLDPVHDVAGTYERIARSIAAYERSAEVNPFTSKYDCYLAGQVSLTPQEQQGLGLFDGAALCANCHVPPLFTDFTYDNLGVPKNLENPFYGMPPKWNPLGSAWIDYGLGAFLQRAGLERAGYSPDVCQAQLGKFKVPTLRNVDLRPAPVAPDFVKAYGHNGFFKSLEEIVHFYNTRDVAPWPPPEVAMNMNTTEVGNLGLTPDEEAAIVAFLKTLSDGYVCP